MKGGAGAQLCQIPVKSALQVCEDPYLVTLTTTLCDAALIRCEAEICSHNF